MTLVRNATYQQPPLNEVAVGDVVWCPVFTSDEAGGAPFWLRITAAGPVDGRHQDVTGVRIVPHTTASGHAEAERVIQVRLPLDRAGRRVFVPVQPAAPTPAVGRAQVTGQQLPHRQPNSGPR